MLTNQASHFDGGCADVDHNEQRVKEGSPGEHQQIGIEIGEENVVQ